MDGLQEHSPIFVKSCVTRTVFAPALAAAAEASEPAWPPPMTQTSKTRCGCTSERVAKPLVLWPLNARDTAAQRGRSIGSQPQQSRFLSWQIEANLNFAILCTSTVTSNIIGRLISQHTNYFLKT